MKRKYTQLTDTQRYQIEAYLRVGTAKSFIALELGIDRTTLYRELKRNCTKRGYYRAGIAQELSDERKERYGRGRKSTKEKQVVIDTCPKKEQWSPKQTCPSSG